MIRHILIDLDGVLCDFVRGALELHGGLDRLPDWPPGRRDIHAVLGISKSQFWGRIDETDGFWEGLAPYPWKDALLTESRRYAPFSIATSPAFHHGCATQKVAWMRRHLRRDFTDFLIGSQKWLMARPGSVLIDDSDRNVDEFRAHGGHAILFPQPWNSLHAISDRMGYLAAELAKCHAE
jgi:hypothetical protein